LSFGPCLHVLASAYAVNAVAEGRVRRRPADPVRNAPAPAAANPPAPPAPVAGPPAAAPPSCCTFPTSSP